MNALESFETKHGDAHGNMIRFDEGILGLIVIDMDSDTIPQLLKNTGATDA